MIVRVLWPQQPHTQSAAGSDGRHLLLGALVPCCVLQDQQVLVAAVVLLQPWDAHPGSLQRLGGRLAGASVQLPFSQQTAALAVLGEWLPASGQHAAAFHDASSSWQHSSSSSVWLCCRGSAALQDALSPGSVCCRQPTIDVQHSTLPGGVRCVQVFSYAVPAQQPGYTAVQLPHPQAGPTVPWMVRPPGTVTFTMLMHLLQQAHAALACGTAGQPGQGAAAAAGSDWQRLVCAAAAADGSCKQPGGRSWSVRIRPPSVVRQLLRQRQRPAGSGSAAAQSGAGGRLQLVVQHLLGLLVALNLVLHWTLLLDAAACTGVWLQERLLAPHIAWLAEAQPAGVKLHLELSWMLGDLAQAVLGAVAAAYRSTWRLLGPAALTAQAAAAAVGGASWACAAAADLLLLLLAPLVGVYVGCAAAHRLQLKCLSLTWRLIRGRQKVRRFGIRHVQQQQQQQQEGAGEAAGSSTASSAAGTSTAEAAAAGPRDEVSVDQLIVGVLLFTPLLGLLPTTAAWYLSVCALYGGLHTLRLLLVGVGSWMQLRPLHVLAARWSRPQLFPGQLMVRPLRLAPATAGASPAVAVAAAAAAAAAAEVADEVGAAPGSVRQRRTRAGAAAGKAAHQQQQQQQQHRRRQQQEHAPVSYFSVSYEPLGYMEVLAQSVRQQQGLLWFVCQGGRPSGDGSSGGAPNSSSTLVGSVLSWLGAVVAGRTWGLRVLSTHWW